MRNKMAIITFSLAIGISVLAGLLFFVTRIPDTTLSEPVERPYNRTSEQPPSAVPDETSHPDLVDEESLDNPRSDPGGEAR
ncbi:hypothetical protein FE840_013630 [Peteryoungia desertarenae]|uniref:Uncharacterized protein n=1 Tax=Peteryoungia desertarenae TaxID=1813451 RepID=A0ABX6QPG5_9HYPH|nr:hypothetical protein [Peteryoungia desertarenae]QLF70489.1 hypothetical protein FE840_013630 [Peteryoungia desertarenae]